MDIRSIRVQHGHHNRKLGRIVCGLCDEIKTLRRKVAIQQSIMTQVMQLTLLERLRQSMSKAA